MQKFSGVLVLLAGAILVTGKSVLERSNVDSISALKTVSNGNSKFSFDLLKAIGGDQKDNLVASPLSLHAALGFLSQGSKGSTKQQILKAAYLPGDDEVTRAGFRTLLTPMRSNANYTLNLGDAAFVEKTFSLEKSFQEVARSSFRADTESLDFASDTTGAIAAINQWVEENTAGKIRNLVSSSDVSSGTKVVLANTLYFKGTWEKGFNSSLTKKQAFRVDSETSVQTDMMTTTDGFSFAVNKDLGAKVLALDYKGKEARMLIVLPNKVDGLAELESSISSLDKIKAGLFPESVEVTLPKFNIEQELNYNSVLQELGITTLFTSEADLTGISETGELSVSEVKQKASIEVSEDGTVAAAATEVDMPGAVLTHEFKADHGFLYVLEHVPSSSVLMYGRYTKP
ncbi:leukocyte elastase inhibitor-like [Bacillus rossius redtenbacheri]|uniref:leukocyte elastase inhibitor-like n=1 Tax=Bacillus rossius redtenbacheri TaxID=93214 RepID=UPI002FDE328E